MALDSTPKQPRPPGAASSRPASSIAVASRVVLLVAAVLMGLSGVAYADFGLTTTADSYTVDTDAGLVFSIRRTDNGSSTQSPGDIRSLVYNGVEYQNQSRGTHVNSGFDFLGYPSPAVSVSAETVGTDIVKITVVASELTHYYVARRGEPRITMGTYFTQQPITGGALCRYIVRTPHSLLPDGPLPSEINGNTGAVESGDIFGMPNGEVRSKHYSNMRAIDWRHIGATGDNVGAWILRDRQEGSSGGPFYRSLLMQGAGDQEITYIVNYGQAQTEPLRTGVLNMYTLVFTDGETPAPVDLAWLGDLNLTGFVESTGRGDVTCASITGLDSRYEYTVGFANAQAQYWAPVSPDEGRFYADDLIPGEYTLTVYKNEMEVHTAPVTVAAGQTTVVPPIDIVDDPSQQTALWRIGEWDGTPREFLNGDKVTIMHPSDVRMDTWATPPYVVGVSEPATGMPAYMWKDINGNQVVRFDLGPGQLVNSTIRVGITCAYSGARPNIMVNSWTSSFNPPPDQPDTRSLTTGTYRGNNIVYSFNVPASALVPGTNTLQFGPISGSGLSGFLSAGYSLDCLDMIQAPGITPAPGKVAGLDVTGAGGNANLTWFAAGGADGYLVERATTSGGPFRTIAEVHTLACSDTGLAPGMDYFYRVKALNGAGAGLPSDEASIAIAGDVAPFVYLPMDESGGTTVFDASGNGWNGTINGGAVFESGVSGNAINLNRNGQHISLPAGIVSDANDVTIAMWVKIDAATRWSRIIDFGDDWSNRMSLSVAGANGAPRFSIDTPSIDEQVIDSFTPIPLGEWTHIAVSLSGSTGTIYLNGVPTGQSGDITLRPWRLGETSNNYIGRSIYEPDPDIDGRIDEFRIYQRGLTGPEVYELWGGSTNNAPVFDERPTQLPEASTGADYSTLAENLNDYVTDPDGDDLTFTKVHGPSWLTVSPDGSLSGAPLARDAGPNVFGVRVQDPSGASDTVDISIDVVEVLLAPGNLTASRTGEDVVLRWTPRPNAQSYIVRRGIRSGGPYAPLALGVTGDRFVDTTASTDRAWFYVLRSVNATSTSAFSVEAAASAADVVAVYPFDEASGGMSPDASANAWDATLFNEPTLTGGVSGEALQLQSGSGQFATLPAGIVSGLEDFTISCWVRLSSLDSWSRIFDFGTGTTNYMFLTPQPFGTTGLMRFAIRTPSQGEQAINSAVSLPLNEWVHVAVTLRDTMGVLYLNGSPVGDNPSLTLDPASLGFTTNNAIGDSQFASDPFLNGAVDDFRIYPFAFGPEAIEALSAPTPPTTDWRFR